VCVRVCIYIYVKNQMKTACQTSASFVSEENSVEEWDCTSNNLQIHELKGKGKNGRVTSTHWVSGFTSITKKKYYRTSLNQKSINRRGKNDFVTSTDYSSGYTAVKIESIAHPTNLKKLGKTKRMGSWQALIIPQDILLSKLSLSHIAQI